MRRLLGVALAASAALALGLGTYRLRHAQRHDDVTARTNPLRPPIVQVTDAKADGHAAAKPPPLPPLTGLNLLRMRSDGQTFSAPTDAGTARLTLEPELQEAAVRLLRVHRLHEAAITLIDVATGKLLVYASHVEQGPQRDLCAEASAPSASLFKIVTAAALLEDAHVRPDAPVCYSGGEQRVLARDLIEDPQRDRWCTTLAGALGHSINTVFARLATEHLVHGQLEQMAERFGYGSAPEFDAQVQPSSLHLPTEPLEFARTAAGFWNSTLSPLHATQISATIARGGEARRATIVRTVEDRAGAVLPEPSEQPPGRRVVARDTADQLAEMMTRTVSEGTSFRAFHDARGSAFLPSISVAGKTGTLTSAEMQRFYTWFTGFAPRAPDPTLGQVAIGVLVVNGPAWQVKANVIARDMLRAYFASRGAPGVTSPRATAIARRGAKTK
jgi:cell division protein FtsI/penicillin-binding protein 2